MSKSWFANALKEAAILLVKEVERHDEARQTLLCASCKHPRADHCGCGMHCISAGPCDCKGFDDKLKDGAEAP